MPPRPQAEHGRRRPAPLVAARDREQDADAARSRGRRRRRSRSARRCAARSPARSTARGRSTTTPRPAASQNSTCQSLRSVTSALIGRPSAPPTPRVALMRAIARSTRSSCSTSRRIEMPSGTTPTIAPCSVRPDDDADDSRRQRRDDRADDHDREQHQHDPPLAVHVAEAPRDRREDRRGEQRRGHDPRGVLAARVEQLGQLRLDRHDEREHERRGEARERQHRDDGALARHPGEASSCVLIP